MTSVVTICNLALSQLGKDNINALSEASSEARACTQFYAQTRNALLQTYPWRFAEKTQLLAEIENDRKRSWAHAFKAPGDMAKLLYVKAMETNSINFPDIPDFMRHCRYHIAGGKLYCNSAPVAVCYTAIITDPTLYPPLFIEALANHLALGLSMPLTRDPKMREQALQLARMARINAQTADANDGRIDSNYISEFIEVR